MPLLPVVFVYNMGDDVTIDDCEPLQLALLTKALLQCGVHVAEHLPTFGRRKEPPMLVHRGLLQPRTVEELALAIMERARAASAYTGLACCVYKLRVVQSEKDGTISASYRLP